MKEQSGIGLTTILFIVFLVLKLTNQIDWSWWWITSPLWIPIGIALLLWILHMVFSDYDMVKNNITTICAIVCTLIMIGVYSLSGGKLSGLDGFFTYVGFYVIFKLHEIENIFRN